MKVLIQNSVFFPQVIGGAEMSSHLLGQELRARGIAADAVATTGQTGAGSQLATRPTADGKGIVYEAPAHGLCDIYGADGVPAPPGILTRGLHHFASVHSARWRRLLGEVLEKSQPDILHTNTIVGMTPTIWQAAREKGIPVVHTLRDYHLLCPRTTLLRSNQTDCENPPVPCRILARLKIRQTHQVEVVTAPSRFVLEKHVSAGGFRSAQQVVVPNACEYLPPVLPERPATPVRGLYLGQLDTHKGVALLMETLAGIFVQPDFEGLEFDLAGAGPLEKQVAEFCGRSAGRARFHGVVKGQDKYDLLARASFLVVPSLWNDNFPRSILDGFSWGIPVIGTDRGGIPEVIRDRQEGLIIPSTGPALAAAMAAMLSDRDSRISWGRQARGRAEEFTLEKQVDRFVAVYESVL